MKRDTILLPSRSSEWLSFLFWLAVAIVMILIMSCSESGAVEWQTGTVVYVDYESGFYGIVRDDGEKLVPSALPDGYRTDGLRIRFSGRIDDETLAIWNWGKPFRLDSIEQDPGEWITGTIRYIDLEGGFYGIIADDGTEYLPNRLDDEFRVDGLRVRFTGTPDAEWASIYQWGQEFAVHQMEKL
jgi:hypothetical protein